MKRRGSRCRFCSAAAPVGPGGPGYQATEHTRPWTLPPREKAWREWCRAVATRYKGRVRFYEIWNEPDIGFWSGTVDEYLEILRAASEEIRAADPEAVILTGGFASAFHKETKPGMVRRVLVEGRDWFDRVAWHRHGHFGEFEREIDSYLIPLLAATGTSEKPIHFTETAMDTRQGERYQAEALVKKITFAKARGAVAYTWFNFHDFNRKNEKPTAPGTTYGLFTREGKIKESARAYEVLIDELDGAEPVRQIELPSGEWAFLFRKKTGGHSLVWNSECGMRNQGALSSWRKPNFRRATSVGSPEAAMSVVRR